ncbi:hypothetical protein ID866_9363 [Astraeus odoratus]|nr:hypothetical protein ID866_9363 [Astraeus odoratus]
MAPHNEDDDPAVYRSGSSKKSESRSASKSTAPQKEQSDNIEEQDDNDEMEEDGEDEGTLLTVQPNFNCLLLVLRDEGVLRFVKYVSAAAAGSRWDICGEFEVGMIESDEEDEQDEEA